MDVLMNKFDFSSFSFKDTDDLNVDSKLPETSQATKEMFCDEKESAECGRKGKICDSSSNEKDSPVSSREKISCDSNDKEQIENGRKVIFCDSNSSESQNRKAVPKPIYYRQARRPKPFIDDSEEEEEEPTISNRNRAAKTKSKFKLSSSSSAEDSDEDEEDSDEDVFAIRTRSGRKSDRKANKRVARKPKTINRFDDHDISDYRPLRKTNRSITIGYDEDKASLSKPLKMLSEKLIKTESTGRRQKNLVDEIHHLLDGETTSTGSNDSKKRKLNRFSDEDADSDIMPVKKKNKKKKVIYSEDEDEESSSKQNGDCPDDIQVILDEDDQSDEDYESDANLMTSDSSEGEEELEEDDDGQIKVSKTRPDKQKKLVLKDALLKLCNEATESELMSVTSMNKKMYEELVSLRNYEDWPDLIKKFENSMFIAGDIQTHLSEYAKTKNVISNIMDQCQFLSNKIKSSVTNLKENREPKCLNKKLKLKPYQLVGLNFLVLMFKQKMNCILADEMGLGKTIQVIALLAYLREECSIMGPHLIVVPSSILANWVREFTLWCPRIKVLEYYGSQDERAELRYDIISKSVPYDVIITTYNMLYSGDDKKLLTRVRFQYAVFDEAHMLKNMKSSRFKNLFAVKAKYRLMLTGTPIQNNLLELISLLTFTVPTLFYSKLNFMENFFKNKKFDDNKSEFVQEKTDQAKEILKPFILRRIKENVLKELPGKIEQYVTLEMTEDQANLYNRIVTMYSERVKARKERKEREKREKTKDKIEIIEDRSRRRKKQDYDEDKLFYVEELDKSSSKMRETSFQQSTIEPEETQVDTNGVKEEEITISDSDSNDVKGKKVFKLKDKLKNELIEIHSESSSSDFWSSEDGKIDDKTVKDRQGSILMELRKCANHPLLVRNLYTNELLLKMAQILKKKEPYYQKDGNVSYMVEDMQVLNDFDLHMLCKKFRCINQFKLDDSKILESNKFRYLDQSLTEFKEKNQKVLIFSQFVMMLDIIEEYLKIKNIKYCRLDGSTKVTDRMDTIDSFKDKEVLVFMLTTKAGGVGINLVEANNVIMHDSDFNPYNDIQAQARAHRIGQTQEVNIYKLVSDKTVEIHMRKIAEEKLDVGKKITSDKIEQAKNEESSDVKLLLKQALNL